MPSIQFLEVLIMMRALPASESLHSQAVIHQGYFRQCFTVCSSLDKIGCISESAAASPFARSAVT